jgi:acetyl esterase/lipase
VLFLHGGGFVAGGLETHDALCRRLCRAAAADVFALAYPLAPERPFPAALDAAEGALQRLASEAGALGLDPHRLAVAGDSAGGALAAAASLSAARRGAPLRAALLICPILDLAAKSASRRTFARGFFVEAEAFAADVAAYAGGRDLEDPRLSPLRSPSLADAPPTLLHLAPFDPFHDEGLAYAAALAEAGVQVRTTDHAGMIHYFAALGGALPAARGAVDQMGAELGALLHA